jgi:hypothetical protein
MPGETRLRLYGEVTGEEGMRYRYFLGEILQPTYGGGDFCFSYPEGGIPMPFYYSNADETLNLYAIFPDNTILGLETY